MNITPDGTRVMAYGKVGIVNGNDLETTEYLDELNYYIVEEGMEWDNYFMVRQDHVKVI